MPLHNPIEYQAGAGIAISDGDDTVAVDVAYAFQWQAEHTFTQTSHLSHALPRATDTYDLGSSTLLWRKGWLSELDAVLFAQQTITLLGGWFIVGKNEGTLAADAPAASGSMDFGQAMTVGHFVVLRAALKVEYVQVGTLVSGTVYNVTRDLDGTGANDWPAGTPYLVLGTSGDGRIELNAYDTPRLSILQQGATYNAQTEVARLGDLSGNWGYASETYGVALGQYASGQVNITVDPSNGIRIRNWATTLAQWANDGSLTVGEVGAGKSNVYIAAGSLKLRNNTADVIALNADGSASFEGVLGIGAAGGIYQGTGTFTSPVTGLKVYNSGGMGLLELWGSGTKQAYMSTDGKLYAGAGAVSLGAQGVILSTNATTGDSGYLQFVSEGLPRGKMLLARVSGVPLNNLLYLESMAASSETGAAILRVSRATGGHLQISLSASPSEYQLTVGGYLNGSDHALFDAWETSAGARYLRLYGHVALGEAGDLSDYAVVNVKGATFLDPAGDVAGLTVSQVVAAVAATMGHRFSGLSSTPTIGSANTYDWTHAYGLVGTWVQPAIEAGATGTVANAAGLVVGLNNAGSGAVTNWSGLRVLAPSGNVSNKWAIYGEQNAGLGYLYDGMILGPSAAQSGLLRLPNNQWIAARNAANSADVNILRLNASNQIELGAALTTASQVISTVATGTAPFSVASTTKVANLNADLLDDLDTSSDVSAGTAAILKSNSSGVLALARLSLGGTFFLADGATVLATAQAGSGAYSYWRHYLYSTTTGNYPTVILAKSHADTQVGAQTLDGEYLGGIFFSGHNTAGGRANGAYLLATQVGAAGATYIGGKLSFLAGTNAAAPTEKFALSGAGIGFFGVTPVARASAYTQTYSTADKTHATPTAQALSMSVGTGDTTVQDVGTSFNQTTLNNNFRDLVNQVNNLRNDHLDLAQLVNAIIDDLQAYGLLQ